MAHEFFNEPVAILVTVPVNLISLSAFWRILLHGVRSCENFDWAFLLSLALSLSFSLFRFLDRRSEKSEDNFDSFREHLAHVHSTKFRTPRSSAFLWLRFVDRCTNRRWSGREILRWISSELNLSSGFNHGAARRANVHFRDSVRPLVFIIVDGNERVEIRVHIPCIVETTNFYRDSERTNNRNCNNRSWWSETRVSPTDIASAIVRLVILFVSKFSIVYLLSRKSRREAIPGFPFRDWLSR